eukprot:scaffold11154_cov101-Isochrysis_galbana.AAC.3
MRRQYPLCPPLFLLKLESRSNLRVAAAYAYPSEGLRGRTARLARSALRLASMPWLAVGFLSNRRLYMK